MFPQPQPKPTHLSTRQTACLELSKDKLTISYKGQGQHESDVGAIQANCPVPSDQLVFYFEAKVVAKGDRCRASIGFTDGKFKGGKQPGTERGSYGYYSEDGRVYHDEDKARDYGATYTRGDVVGAGVDLERGDIFFTKNGVHLGTAFSRIRQSLYPTVSVHSPGEVVSVNFGQEAFVYDIAALEAQMRSTKRRLVEASTAASHVAPSAPRRLIRDYLLHMGYPATLAALTRDAGEAEEGDMLRMPSGGGVQPLPPTPLALSLESSLAARGEVRALIMEGRIGEAEAALVRHFPGAMSDPLGAAGFSLACQRVVEEIRGAMGGREGGAGDTLGVIAVAREVLGPIVARLLLGEGLGEAGGTPGPSEGEGDQAAAGRMASEDSIAAGGGGAGAAGASQSPPPAMGEGEDAPVAVPPPRPPFPLLGPAIRARGVGPPDGMGGPGTGVEVLDPGPGAAGGPAGGMNLPGLPPFPAGFGPPGGGGGVWRAVGGLEAQAAADGARAGPLPPRAIGGAGLALRRLMAAAAAVGAQDRPHSPAPPEDAAGLPLPPATSAPDASQAALLDPWRQAEARLAEIGHVMALVCLEDPTSPEAPPASRALLAPERRAAVADTVNEAVVAWLARTAVAAGPGPSAVPATGPTASPKQQQRPAAPRSPLAATATPLAASGGDAGAAGPGRPPSGVRDKDRQRGKERAAGRGSTAMFERVLRQVVACQHELLALNGGHGEPFSLASFVARAGPGGRNAKKE